MHKKELCEKTILFLKTRRTLPKTQKKKIAMRQPLLSPKNGHFFASSGCFFFLLSQQVTISYINIFEYKKLTKVTSKYQNQAWDTTFKS